MAIAASFISTKEAARRTGYSTDYVSRLLRAGDIRGVREGRFWMIDPESLATFVERKQGRSERRSAELSNARRESYQVASSAVRYFNPPLVRSDVVRYAPISQAAALTVATLLVFCGWSVSATRAMPILVAQLSGLAEEASSGFTYLAADLGSSIQQQIAVARDASRSARASIRDRDAAYRMEGAFVAAAARISAVSGATAFSAQRDADPAAQQLVRAGAAHAAQMAEAVRIALASPDVLLAGLSASGNEGLGAASAGADALASSVNALGRSIPGASAAAYGHMGGLIVRASRSFIAAHEAFSYRAAAVLRDGTRETVRSSDALSAAYGRMIGTAGAIAYEAYGLIAARSALAASIAFPRR
jgi:excisionase family DNA binding protein